MEQLFFPLFDEVPELSGGSRRWVVFFLAYDGEVEVQIVSRLEADEGIMAVGQRLAIVFLRDTDCQSDCFFWVFDGIVDRPIGPPRSNGIVYILIFTCSDPLYSGDQGSEGVGKENLAQDIAVAGKDGVAYPHIECIGRGMARLPPIDFDLDDRANRTIGDDTLCARGKGFYLLQIVSGIWANRAYSDCVSDFEYIVAVAESEEAIVGIPEGLREFQLRLAFGIDIDCLPCIEVNTVCHQFGLEGNSVVVHKSERLIGREKCLRGDGFDAIGFAFGGMLPILSTDIALAIHFCPHLGGVVRSGGR